MMTPQTFRFRFEFPSKEMAEAAIVQLQMAEQVVARQPA